MTRSLVSLDNLVGLVSFFGIFGFRGVKIPKVENSGKCHDLERKCKILIQGWQREFSWGFRCKTNGGHMGGLWG